MKKMKTVTLCLLLTAAMILPVYAADPPGSETKDVTVNVTAADTVYSVKIEWSGDPSFAYNEGTWNPQTHQMDDAGWTDRNPRNVTITNHSNAAVNYAAQFASGANAVKNGVTAALSGNASGALESAVGKDVEAAAKGTFSVGVDGTPDKTGTFTVGTVTISFS